MTTTLTIANRGRDLTFDGELIGESSSFVVGRDRWSELKLYRVIDGRYVVSTIGRSSKPGDSDIAHATVCETATAAVEALHRYDDHEVRYLTAVARRCLEAACDADRDLHEAFHHEQLTA